MKKKRFARNACARTSHPPIHPERRPAAVRTPFADVADHKRLPPPCRCRWDVCHRGRRPPLRRSAAFRLRRPVGGGPIGHGRSGGETAAVATSRAILLLVREFPVQVFHVVRSSSKHVLRNARPSISPYHDTIEDVVAFLRLPWLVTPVGSNVIRPPPPALPCRSGRNVFGDVAPLPHPGRHGGAEHLVLFLRPSPAVLHDRRHVCVCV